MGNDKISVTLGLANTQSDVLPSVQETSLVNVQLNGLTPTFLPSLPPHSITTASQEIVFVDPNVPDYQTLLNGIHQGTKVVVLDAKQDGIAQISAVLAEQENVSAIHIISHGGPGSLQLGWVWLFCDDAASSCHRQRETLIARHMITLELFCLVEFPVRLKVAA